MKRILITGAASGFGRATVSALLARGHQVFATMRGVSARAEQFQQEVAKYGARLRLMELDVASANDRAYVVGTLGGQLDVLVNNAGYALFGALEDLREAQLRAQWEVNFVSAALLTQELLPSLRARSGAVINVSSVFGFSGFPLTSAYCASKFAMEGLSESLYHELRPHGVRVHLLEPGAHRTGFSSRVHWGQGREQVYRRQTDAYHELKDELTRRGGASPDAVATRIVELVERPSATLRIPVGTDARLAALVMSIPDRVRARLQGLMFDRMLSTESES